MTFLAINLSIFFTNLILFLYAKKITDFFNNGEEDQSKANTFKLFNILFFLAQMLDLFFQAYSDDFIKFGYSLVVVYIAMLIFETFSYLNRIKFGNKKALNNDKIVHEDNYNTRINNIIIFVLIFILSIIIILNIWHMESSLQQTGFIGIILAFLAFTSNHWLPNIISGLTLMNSNHIAKGDIVKFEDEVYSVFDIGFFYTHLLDITHNSRVLIENAILSKKEITNISKRAGLQGYRDSIVYNIGYPPMTTEKAYDNYINSFESIFEELFEEIDGNENYALNYKSKYDLLLTETADYALRYTFYFYYKDLKVSTTANIRKTFSTKFKLNALIQKKAHLQGISLSTPMLIDQVVKSQTKELNKNVQSEIMETLAQREV
jgi:hypothetical protein